MLQWIEGIAQSISNFVSEVLLGPAQFMEHYVWGWPQPVSLLVIVLVGAGLFVTIRLGFIQIRGFRHAINIVRGKFDDPNDEGDLKHFQALTTALSATVGIGNIAGVAIAIRMGGPGALFWMWVTAFFGMALKFVECTLAMVYRKINKDGSVSGGPMYYIEIGMKKRLGGNWKWMGILFAIFAVICSFASGNMNQSNTLADQMQSSFGVAHVWTALIFAAVVGFVIIGGIQRIGKVTSFLAPFMAAVYVLGATIVLLLHAGDLPSAFALIIRQALHPEALVGGGAASVMLTLMWGVRRGLFSNEAGQGSAPIAHATAKTKEPVREGLVASLGPFIDTLVICSMTGLVILVSGVWQDKVQQTYAMGGVEAIPAVMRSDSDLLRLREERDQAGAEQSVQVVGGVASGVSFVALHSMIESPRWLDAEGNPWSGTLTIDSAGGVTASVTGAAANGPSQLEGQGLLNGAPLTARGFAKGLPGDKGSLIVAFAVLLFAISTAISWSYYGDRATEYLFGSGAIPIYRWIYCGFFFLGAILPLKAVWIIGDVALGLMTFPNLIAVLALSGVVVKLAKDYMGREHTPYK